MVERSVDAIAGVWELGAELYRFNVGSEAGPGDEEAD